MARLTPPIGEGDHVLNPRGRVTLAEYGDYECPFCRRAHFVVLEVLDRLAGSVRFAFRHFPLTQVHTRALLAALAAEAAGAQGKFWPVHHTLFEHQDALAYEDLLGYAEDLELDVRRFTRDLDSDAALQKIRADFRSGVMSGVNGTPTFFVNDLRYDRPWDADSLTAALREAETTAELRG